MSTAMLEQTQEQLRALRLYRTAERLEGTLEEASKQEWTYSDLIRRLVEEEFQAKRERTLSMRTVLARFPYVKTLESFDFKFQPSLDAKRVRDLAACRFIPNGENVVLLGPPGVGKTHLGGSPWASKRSKLASRCCSPRLRTCWAPWAGPTRKGGWRKN